MFYLLSIPNMPKPDAVKDWAPATQDAGANPADKNTLTFEEQAQAILDEMNGGKKEESKEAPTEPPKDETKETPKEEPKKDEPSKEENKIPLSRLNKEIDKRKFVEEELNIVKQKLEKEQERIKWLSEEDKEEQETFKKLWLETKEEKLLEKLESLERELKLSWEKIKSYEEELNSARVEKLSARISNLTKEYDWSNGLPKFDIKELLEFWKSENYMPEDPIKLYNLKYQAEIYASKYKKEAPEVDKWNKDTFTPTKKKLIWFDDPEFEKEALAIINSIS